jgi:hypothetical protein
VVGSWAVAVGIALHAAGSVALHTADVGGSWAVHAKSALGGCLAVDASHSADE